MDANSTPPRPRRGFTMVELLIVIVIIGILMGLLTPAVITVLNKAKTTAIHADLKQLEMAVEEYRTNFTDFPPDFFDVSNNNAAQASVARHFRKAFPKYIPGRPSGTTTGTDWDRISADFTYSRGLNDLSLNGLDPASALVFCLGGPPDPTSKQLLGFSANPRNPFQPGGGRLPKLFDFKETRLKGFANGAWQAWPVYTADKTDVPYIYFRPRQISGRSEYAYDDGSGNLLPLFHGSGNNICVAYLASAGDPTNPGGSNVVRRWNNPDTFQIISPGLDEEFGNAPIDLFRLSTTGEILPPPPPGAGFDFANDYDNITNFISNGTLEDAL